jgi:hypothetical protein
MTEPPSIEEMFDRAHAALRADDWATAERGYRALMDVRPYDANQNLGVLCVATRRFAEAEAYFRAALGVDPTAAVTRHSLAMLLLGGGDYPEGWRLYESRRETPGSTIPRPPFSYPEWRGEALAGQRLIVVGEQGLGDQIMFARFIPELERRGASVVYICEPVLVPLFRASGLDAVTGERLDRADYWVLLGSLPGLLGVTVEGLSGAPYLTAEPSGRGGVGVKARGAALHGADRYRSLSDDAAAQLEAMGRSLDPAATGARDFLETAQIIAGLDLVITVDTSVAHLAGALGKPVWILLAAAHTDWRWLRDRDDSPWYASARLYRQETPRLWAPVMQRIAADLAEAGA